MIDLSKIVEDVVGKKANLTCLKCEDSNIKETTTDHYKCNACDAKFTREDVIKHIKPKIVDAVKTGIFEITQDVFKDDDFIKVTKS